MLWGGLRESSNMNHREQVVNCSRFRSMMMVFPFHGLNQQSWPRDSVIKPELSDFAMPTTIVSSESLGLPDRKNTETEVNPSIPTSKRPRRRALRACWYCRERKIQCDMAMHGSPCTNCKHSRAHCALVKFPNERLACKPDLLQLIFQILSLR